MSTRLSRSGLINPESTLPLAAVVTGIGSLVLPWTASAALGKQTLLELGASVPLLTVIAVVGAITALAAIGVSRTNRVASAIALGAVSGFAAISAWGLTPLQPILDGGEVRRDMGSYLLLFSAGLALAGAISQRNRRVTVGASDDEDLPPAA